MKRLVARARAINDEHGLIRVAVLVVAKLWVLAAVHVQRRVWSGRTFEAFRTRYPYFIHQYNATWRNERAVEVAVALDFMRRCGRGRGLEVGNVLSHYAHVSHTVVDKYERGTSVLNKDVAVYVPPFPLDYVVSVSTFEHVGWDEDSQDSTVAVAAIQRLRGFLTTEGRMLITIPLGHNPGLDDAVRSRRLLPSREAFLIRDRRGWTEVDAETAFAAVVPLRGKSRFGRNPPTHAIWLAELTRISLQ